MLGSRSLAYPSKIEKFPPCLGEDRLSLASFYELSTRSMHPFVLLGRIHNLALFPSLPNRVYCGACCERKAKDRITGPVWTTTLTPRRTPLITTKPTTCIIPLSSTGFGLFRTQRKTTVASCLMETLLWEKAAWFIATPNSHVAPTKMTSEMSRISHALNTACSSHIFRAHTSPWFYRLCIKQERWHDSFPGKIK